MKVRNLVFSLLVLASASARADFPHTNTPFEKQMEQASLHLASAYCGPFVRNYSCRFDQSAATLAAIATLEAGLTSSDDAVQEWAASSVGYLVGTILNSSSPLDPNGDVYFHGLIAAYKGTDRVQWLRANFPGETSLKYLDSAL